jgi:hypothetical protein
MTTDFCKKENLHTHCKYLIIFVFSWMFIEKIWLHLCSSHSSLVKISLARGLMCKWNLKPPSLVNKNFPQQIYFLCNYLSLTRNTTQETTSRTSVHSVTKQIVRLCFKVLCISKGRFTGLGFFFRTLNPDSFWFHRFTEQGVLQIKDCHTEARVHVFIFLVVVLDHTSIWPTAHPPDEKIMKMEHLCKITNVETP